MPKKPDEILEQARERFNLSAEADRDERSLADEDIRFAINDEGCQWPDDLRAEREDDHRPCLVLNKITEKVDQVEGEFRQLKPSFKVRGIDNNSDPKLAEVIAGIMRHIEYNSDARNAYNTSFSNTCYMGRGAWRIDIVDAEDDPFVRDIVINRIPNPLTVYWDPFAQKADKSDAKYWFVTEIINKKEFEREHKDVVDQWPNDDMWDNWRTNDGYRIAEYWYKEKDKQKYYRVRKYNMDGSENITTVTTPEYDDEVIEEKEIDKNKVFWCKMVGTKILDGPNEWPTSDIPIILQVGKEVNVRGVGKSRGLVRHAKEPQRMYNYWSSQVTEQVALAPKSPYLVTAGMIAEFQDMWNTAHTKNWPYLVYTPDERIPGATPRREPPPMVSSAYQAEFMRLEHDIMSAMGIYAAQLGDKSNEMSGVAIQSRQRQGNIGSYPYTDSFHTSYIYSCKQLVRLIPHVYDTERIMRIIGEDGEADLVPINARPNLPQVNNAPKKYLAEPKDGVSNLLNDMSVGKYDVAVTIGPSYSTQREETLAMLLDLVKTVPAAGQVIMDLIVKNMDLPHSEELVSRLKKLVPPGVRDLEPGEEPPQQQPDPRMMLEMAKLQMEKETRDREAERKEFEAQMKAIADLTTAEAKEAGAQVQAMTAFVEQIRAHMDMQHNQLMQVAQTGHQMNMDRQNLDMQQKQAEMQNQTLPVGSTGQNSPEGA